MEAESKKKCHAYYCFSSFVFRLVCNKKRVDFISVPALFDQSKMTTRHVFSHADKEKKKRAVDLLKIVK